MKHNYLIEIVLSAVLILLTILLLNPFHFWMPTPVHMGMIAVFIVLFVLFASYIWKERSHDEREMIHRASSGRIAFLSGTAVLATGIIIQSLAHTLDPIVIIALVVMILAKIVSQLYYQFYH